MRYLIRKEQAAALGRVLRKMKDARLGKIIGLTEKELQAWKDKVPYWDGRDDLDIDAFLEDVPDPTPEASLAPKKQKRTLIRWMKINKENNIWTAGSWRLDTPGARRGLKDVISKWQAEPELVGNPSYEYSIDEREAQDDENY